MASKAGAKRKASVSSFGGVAAPERGSESLVADAPSKRRRQARRTDRQSKPDKREEKEKRMTTKKQPKAEEKGGKDSKRRSSKKKKTKDSPSKTAQQAGADTREAKEKAERECTVCCETHPLCAFAEAITSSCKHQRSVCGSCVARTINMEVKGKGNSTTIRCPQKDCSAVLDHADVRRQATNAVFQLFDHMLFKRHLQQMQGFRWCAHEGCGNGQVDIELEDDGQAWNRFMRCSACQRRTCLHHKCKWHDGRTCKQYEEDARASEEVALLQFFEREGIKRCPDCGHAIEKKGGCDHMICAKSAGGCGGEFCMRCTARYKGPRGIWAIGNSAHHSSCPYHF